jgi:hypothetical protein
VCVCVCVCVYLLCQPPHQNVRVKVVAENVVFCSGHLRLIMMRRAFFGGKNLSIVRLEIANGYLEAPVTGTIPYSLLLGSIAILGNYIFQSSFGQNCWAFLPILPRA